MRLSRTSTPPSPWRPNPSSSRVLWPLLAVPTSLAAAALSWHPSSPPTVWFDEPGESISLLPIPSEPDLAKRTANDLVPPRPLRRLLPLQPVVTSPCPGVVTARVLVSSEGAALGVQLDRLSPENRSCEDAVIAYLFGVNYSPGLRQGRPVVSWVELPVTFAQPLAHRDL